MKKNNTTLFSTALYSLLSILLITNEFFGQNTGWSWQYPKPQGNRLFEIQCLDKNTSIAAGELGTVIKTTDGGYSWKSQNYFDETENTPSFCFLKDRKDGWAISGYSLWKTSDGGNNWSKILSDSSYNFSSICFINADTGWVIRNKVKVMKTENGGKSWITTTLYTGYSSTSGLAYCKFADDTTGWISGYNFDGLVPVFKTTDAGKTWNRITNIQRSVGYVSKMAFLDKNTGWLASNSGILRTTDGGVSWTISAVPGSINSICILANDAIIAAGGKGSSSENTFILRSTDNGNTWNEVEVGTPGGILSLNYTDNLAWAAGENGIILKSTDKGTSWTLLSDKLYQLTSIHFSDENNGWAVGDSIILHTKNKGDNWNVSIISRYLQLFSVFTTDGINVTAVGLENKYPSPRKAVILRSTDKGVSWNKEVIDTIPVLYSTSFISKMEGWTAGDSSILKTTDGGSTWKRLNVSPAIKNISRIQFVNSQTGWALSGITRILKTNDGGISWVDQKTDPGLFLRSLFFIDENTGWIVGEYQNNKNIYKTTDGGNTWLRQNLQEPCSLWSVFLANKNVGWTAGYRSSDQKGVIYKTTDGGENWIKQKYPSDKSIYSLFFTNENTGWAAGSGIFKTTTGGTTSVRGHYEIPNKIKLLQNYPNPFNPSTTIQYIINSPGHITLKVYDILGKQVKVLVDEWQDAGDFRLKLSSEELASGIYFYTLIQNDNNETRKLLLIK